MIGYNAFLILTLIPQPCPYSGRTLHKRRRGVGDTKPCLDLRTRGQGGGLHCEGQEKERSAAASVVAVMTSPRSRSSWRCEAPPCTAAAAAGEGEGHGRLETDCQRSFCLWHRLAPGLLLVDSRDCAWHGERACITSRDINIMYYIFCS